MEYNYYYSKDLELPDLHRAAKTGDRAKVKRMLKGGINPDERGNYKDTPLMWAACGGNCGIVADLLKAGADIEAVDDNKSTPLHHAAEKGRDEVVADLLAAGANAKAVDMLEMTALHQAALVDSSDCIVMLAKSGVDPNREDKEGNIPLYYAALSGHPAAIRALIKSGADASIAHQEDGATALHLAALSNSPAAVHVLADCRINLNATDDRGNTAMHEAARSGHVNVVSTLIDVGAKVNILNEAKETPLFLAQRAGHTDIADMLISADKDINSAKLPKGEYIAQRIYEGAWRRIVAIEIYSGAEIIGEGSGVIIDSNLVATNFHVVEHGKIEVFKAEERRARMPFRKTKERRINKEVSYRAEKICAIQPKQDFCILEVPDLGGEEIEVRASHTLRVGEEVYAIGNPQGVDLTLSAGVISQLRDNGFRNCREIQTNAAISPGSSGGGLFDKDGNLVGLTTSGIVGKDKRDAPQNLNFAIPADLIWGCLPNNLHKQKPAAKGKGGKR